MVRQVKIARDGEELGAWPFDVVIAFLRCGSLVPTDTYWTEGSEAWEPLSDVIPPCPSHTKEAIFLGRDDEEQSWTFFCRDGVTIIGPRPIDEIMYMIFLGTLDDDHCIFIPGREDRWISVADFMRRVEANDPETADLRRRIQHAEAEWAKNKESKPKLKSENSDWLNTGLALTSVMPHVGTAYLGFHAAKHFTEWLAEPEPEERAE